jgi:hypothetical protein
MIGVAARQVKLEPPAIVLGVLRQGEVLPALSDELSLAEGDAIITLAALQSRA